MKTINDTVPIVTNIACAGQCCILNSQPASHTKVDNAPNKYKFFDGDFIERENIARIGITIKQLTAKPKVIISDAPCQCKNLNCTPRRKSTAPIAAKIIAVFFIILYFKYYYNKLRPFLLQSQECYDNKLMSFFV